MGIIISISLGLILGIALYALVYKLHPMRTMLAWLRRGISKKPVTSPAANNADIIGTIPEFIRNDMEDKLPDADELYACLQPDYKPTKTEQDYLDKIHPRD